MDELDVKSLLEEKRKTIKTFEDLVGFLKEIKENYNTSYGTSVRAAAQACLAVAWYFSSEFGLTGFQAGFLLWDFIKGWTYTENKTGLSIIDYDDMLYPQCEDRFEKIISSDTWNRLQKEAKKLLENDSDFACKEVREHWESIVNGVIPFGYEEERKFNGDSIR